MLDLGAGLGPAAGAVLLAVAALVVGIPLGLALVSRPQRGLLLLAALLPFDGLLLILPGGSAFGPWKEALVLVTALATLLAPPSALRSTSASAQRTLPTWVLPVAILVVLGAISGVVTGGIVGIWGFKVWFFFLVAPVVLWRCPFDERERDLLVTILMSTGIVTAAVGIGQQVIGASRLNELGYEYNTAIRFSGSLLRSFSTFTQPFSFGLYMTLVLLVCLPVAMADHRRKRNLVFLVASPLLVAGMAASVVRGAALGLGVGLVVLLVWRFRGLAHAMVPAALALLFVPASALTSYLSSSSLGERATGWSAIFDKITSAPLGNGIGTTGASAAKAVELGAPTDGVISLDGINLYLPDNQYVKTVIELGPLGLWLLLVIGAAIVASAASTARRTDGNDRALAQGIAASVVGAAAASTVSTYLEIFPLDFYFWLLAGVLTCPTLVSRSTPSPSVPEAAVSRPTSVSSSVP